MESVINVVLHNLLRRSIDSKSLTKRLVRFVGSLAELPASGCNSSGFGFVFDIDGVITRGRTLLPHSIKAFKHLTNADRKFVVPAVFVTNAGNSLQQTKAKQLSDWLDIEVEPDQVVMSHSPLKMFRQFHSKHVLVSGQGPKADIARFLGFSNIISVEKLLGCFPLLDAIDHRRRKAAPCAFEKYFPKIDAILLLGEPVRWETGLQLLLDVLISNGQPWNVPETLPYPHLPILACNMDLVWMSEAPMPRFGHGCFLHCLETLYHRITGCELKYTALVGKPSEITYHYAERRLQRQAHKLGLPPVHRMYCIGDNPQVDIFGANLFNRSLQRNSRRQRFDETDSESHDFDQELYFNSLDANHLGVTNCESVLVCTGVFDSNRLLGNIASQIQGDFVMDEALCVPSFVTVHNVLEAVQAIFRREVLLEKQRR